MKLRILGCGTSTGVPRIGPDWGECDPNEPRNRRLRCAILVESGGERLLVDCGPDIRTQLLEAGVSAVDRVVITHGHADHCHGLDELRPIAQARGPVPIYARQDVIDQLTQRFDYAFIGSGFYPPVVTANLVPEEMVLGSARVRFVDQPHGDITSLGVRIDEGSKSAVYAIDYNVMTDEMAQLYEGADVLVSDCLQRREHPTHAHLDAVLQWASELGIGKVFLTHMNTSLDYGRLDRELPAGVKPAYDGLEIVL